MKFVVEGAPCHELQRLERIAINALQALPGTRLGWMQHDRLRLYELHASYGEHWVTHEYHEQEIRLAPDVKHATMVQWWRLIYALGDEVIEATARAWADLHRPEGTS